MLGWSFSRQQALRETSSSQSLQCPLPRRCEQVLWVWSTEQQGSGQAGPHSPVSFFKLRLQVADAIPGPWVFLLQQIQAIDHWERGEGRGQ